MATTVAEAAPQAAVAVAPLPVVAERAPVVQLKLGDLPRTVSSASKPPPSPFESVSQPDHALAAPAPVATGAAAEAAHAAAHAPGGSGGEAAAPANGGQEPSPRRLHPAKSALKIRSVTAEGGAAAAADAKGLTWADTHGQAIHHVQEYQPSEHGSESFVKKSLGCGCSIQ
ncbi:hypothetical protein C2E20_6961 [Micractinium conductrix]|uniref:Uncharacterized protein n=1 Tax=Micractinium conductrix TaxID=554055 RepID=A0A2P6V650_9CHLO|nr:hypothetical protein C2E20_6961 [Micractinium conductrix]|eukprot:PSC69562.1 hypothetical protein C2E20_6961 [Micractinium conductrix]